MAAVRDRFMELDALDQVVKWQDMIDGLQSEN